MERLIHLTDKEIVDMRTTAEGHTNVPGWATAALTEVLELRRSINELISKERNAN